MNPNAPLPAIPEILRTPRRPGRHAGAADFVAFRVLGEPLPCLCPDCRDRAAAAERERIDCTTIAEPLPPAFWTRQAARLFSIERGPAPRWRWALVPAAGLLLASALLVLTVHSPRTPDDFEARWAEVQEALDRPALGDLEACTVLFDEGENTLSEESL